jgi:UDP-N-acetyl-D-glucosamine dehydrogenase
VGDTRESPAFQIIPRLIDMGADIEYHDPFVPSVPASRHLPERPELTSQPLTPQLVAAQDAVVIVTDHPSIDYGLVAGHARLIVDTRGVFRGEFDNVVKA